MQNIKPVNISKLYNNDTKELICPMCGKRLKGQFVEAYISMFPVRFNPFRQRDEAYEQVSAKYRYFCNECQIIYIAKILGGIMYFLESEMIDSYCSGYPRR